MPQLRVCMLQLESPHAATKGSCITQLRIPCAATKTRRSLNKYFLKKNKTEFITLLFLWVRSPGDALLGLLVQGLSQAAMEVSAWAAISCEGSTEEDSTTKPSQVATGRPQVPAGCWSEASTSFLPLVLSIGQLTTLQLSSIRTRK